MTSHPEIAWHGSTPHVHHKRHTVGFILFRNCSFVRWRHLACKKTLPGQELNNLEGVIHQRNWTLPDAPSPRGGRVPVGTCTSVGLPPSIQKPSGSCSWQMRFCWCSPSLNFFALSECWLGIGKLLVQMLYLACIPRKKNCFFTLATGEVWSMSVCFILCACVCVRERRNGVCHIERRKVFPLQTGPVRIHHSAHDLATQSSHSVDRAGWQAKMASIEFWIPWRNAHKPHSDMTLVPYDWQAATHRSGSLASGAKWTRASPRRKTKWARHESDQLLLFTDSGWARNGWRQAIGSHFRCHQMQ